MLGEEFHSVVLRMAVHIERIAMILSALRFSSISPESHSGIVCSDIDYATAEIIGNRLLLHMAAAYRLIDGDAQDVVPDIKPLDQRRILFDQLKMEYSNRELISEAQSQGVSRATILRWNERWIEEGLVMRTHHGLYKKVA
jgi:hypothetical protein